MLTYFSDWNLQSMKVMSCEVTMDIIRCTLRSEKLPSVKVTLCEVTRYTSELVLYQYLPESGKSQSLKVTLCEVSTIIEPLDIEKSQSTIVRLEMLVNHKGSDSRMTVSFLAAFLVIKDRLMTPLMLSG